MDAKMILVEMATELIEKLDDRLILNGKEKKAWKDKPVTAYNTAIEEAITVIQKYFKV